MAIALNNTTNALPNPYHLHERSSKGKQVPRQSSLLAVVCIHVLAVAATAQLPTPLSFSVDPTRSFLTLSGAVLNSVPWQPQSPGSNRASFVGNVEAVIDPAHVRIDLPGGSNIVAENGTVAAPGPGGLGASAPANYGVQADFGSFQIKAAVRNLNLDIGSDQIAVARTSWTPDEVIYSFPVSSAIVQITTGLVDVAGGPVSPGTANFAGRNVPNASALPGQLKGTRHGAGTTWELHLPIDATLSSANATERQIGEIVATATTASALAVAPPVIQVTRVPDPELVRVSQPTSLQLEVLNPGGQLNPTKPTVVLSHGWRDSPLGWVASVAQDLLSQHPDLNVVAWNWSIDAGTSFLPSAQSRAPAQGFTLGQALADTLGPNYDQTIHFMGHSLGTIVNRHAVDRVEQFYAPQHVQVTILDSFEPTPLNSNSPFSPIPVRGAAYIDNYVSAFGRWHPEAANVLLLEEAPQKFSLEAPELVEQTRAFHHYPVDWYSQTILSPLASPMGNRFSLERSSTGAAPLPGSVFEQLELNGLHLAEITPTTALSLLQARDLRLLGQTAISYANLFDSIESAIKGVGNVTSEVVSAIVDGIEVPDLQITLTKGSPAYAWLPVMIPEHADFLSFSYTFRGLAGENALTAGIDTMQFLSIEGKVLQDGVAQSTGPIDVSQWKGEGVEIFFGLNSADDMPGGSISIDHIAFFEAVPEPSTEVLALICCVVTGAVARGRQWRAKRRTWQPPETRISRV